MNHRDRFFAATSHDPTDRPPMDFLGEASMRDAVANHLGVASYEEALVLLDVDMRQIHYKQFLPPAARDETGAYEDIWGVVRRPVANQFGVYDEVLYQPFEETEDLRQVEDFPWPTLDVVSLEGLYEQCRAYHDDYSVVFGSPGIMDLINGASYSRGMERLLIDIAVEDPIGMAIMERRQQFFYKLAEEALNVADGLIDVLWIGDDYGTQIGPLVGVDTWSRVFRPRLQAFIDLGHKYQAKVMLHSCGSNRNLIPTWIEMGLDIYQAVQVEAVGMSPDELFREFGNDITFHGMIGLQGVLPHGSPEDVRREVRARINASKGTGYVLAPAHNVQPDVPMDNLFAIYAEARCDR